MGKGASLKDCLSFCCAGDATWALNIRGACSTPSPQPDFNNASTAILIITLSTSVFAIIGHKKVHKPLKTEYNPTKSSGREDRALNKGTSLGTPAGTGPAVPVPSLNAIFSEWGPKPTSSHLCSIFIID